MIWQNVILAFKTLASNKLRSFLSMLGIVIGVASVTLVVSLGEGFKNQIRGEINDLGANLISITPGQFIIKDDDGDIDLNQIDFGSAFGASTLTERDLKTVQDDPDIDAAAPIMTLSGSIEKNGEPIRGATIIATTEDLPEIINQKVVRGSMFSATDKTNIAVVGAGFAEELQGSIDALTTVFEIRGERFVVTGVLEDKTESGASGIGPSLSKAVYIPLTTGKNLNQGVALVQEIDAVISEGADIDTVISRLENQIKANHGGEQDFTILKQEDFLALTDTFSDLATQFVAALASISLVVGGIGIMNIMFAIVTERTREIGLRKAIGASNTNVLLQFLIEAVILSIIGGLLGVGLAYFAVIGITLFTDFSGSFSLSVILMATSVSAIVGILAGVWPAWKASTKDPIESLRFE